MNINPNTNEAYHLLHQGTLALARAEQQGIRVDLEYAERRKQELTDEIIGLEDQFKQTKLYKHWQHTTKKEPNIHSNPQLSYFLYTIKKIDPAKTTVSGQGATDEEALMELNIPELKDLIQIRKLKKVRDTYLEAFIREQVNGYIHPSFNLHLVKTFRSSASNPNFQNIPKRDVESMQICRKALLPRPGHQLMEIDYAALEFRIIATYYKDPTMMAYINDPTTDIHRDMAIKIYKLDEYTKDHKVLRSAAKNGFVFPELYGDYYVNCANNLACGWGELPEGRWKAGQGIQINGKTLSDHLISKGITSLQKFTDHIQGVENSFWNDTFKTGKRWQAQWWRDYQKNGFIDMYTGFRCSGEMSKNNVLNYSIQGAAFHCLLWSFNELDRLMRKEKWQTRLIGQIHDAIVLDVHPDELQMVAKTVRRVTCEDLPRAWKWINVPLDIEIEVAGVDKSWAELKSFA